MSKPVSRLAPHRTPRGRGKRDRNFSRFLSVVSGAVALATRLGVLTQNGDLLPDFARQTRREILGAVDRLQHDRIVNALRVDCRNLSQYGQHLAAVVEVSAEFKGRHRALGRGLRARCVAGHRLRVLGELMHVHDVRQRLEFVDEPQRLFAAPARLQFGNGQNRGAEQQDQVNGRVGPLEKLRDVADRSDNADFHERGTDSENEDRAECPGRYAERDERFGNFRTPLVGLAGDFQDRVGDSGQSGVGEALPDALLKALGSLDDESGLEGNSHTSQRVFGILPPVVEGGVWGKPSLRTQDSAVLIQYSSKI